MSNTMLYNDMEAGRYCIAVFLDVSQAFDMDYFIKIAKIKNRFPT
jgi:hypothetical protein